MKKYPVRCFRTNEEIEAILSEKSNASKFVKEAIIRYSNGSVYDRDWKTAFKVMYSFFRDCMMNISVICPTDQAKMKWNELWSNYSEHFNLISELARLVVNT